MAVTDTIKDAAYVTIGFGVLGFQKAQVRRHELARQLDEQVAGGRKSLTSLAGQVDGYVAPVRSQFASGLDAVESNLPATVQDVVKQARQTLLTQERAVRTRLGLPATAA